jgi:hypothetical protein
MARKPTKAEEIAQLRIELECAKQEVADCMDSEASIRTLVREMAETIGDAVPRHKLEYGTTKDLLRAILYVVEDWKSTQEDVRAIPEDSRKRWFAIIQEGELDPEDVPRMVEVLEELGVSRLARLHACRSVDVRQSLKAFGLVPS